MKALGLSRVLVCAGTGLVGDGKELGLVGGTGCVGCGMDGGVTCGSCVGVLGCGAGIIGTSGLFAGAVVVLAGWFSLTGATDPAGTSGTSTVGMLVGTDILPSSLESKEGVAGSIGAGAGAV